LLKTTIGMGLAALLLAILAVLRGGWELVVEGLLLSGEMLLQVVPLLLLAFITAGLISVVISKDAVSRWLGREAGWKGLLLGALAGALVPGGPYVFFPLAATFLVSGAEIGTVVAFVTAKNLWTVSRLPIEVALIGPEITFIRYVITFIFPIVLGLLANLFFSGMTEKIRESINQLQKSQKV